LGYFPALEDSGDTPTHPAAIRRCASVTVTTTSTDLAYQGDTKDITEEPANVHPSIDDLRQQVMSKSVLS